MRVELLIDVEFDGCVKSHLLVVVREGRRESVPFATPFLYPQSLGRERETLRIHMRFVAPSCKPSVSLKGKTGFVRPLPNFVAGRCVLFLWASFSLKGSAGTGQRSTSLHWEWVWLACVLIVGNSELISSPSQWGWAHWILVTAPFLKASVCLCWCFIAELQSLGKKMSSSFNSFVFNCFIHCSFCPIPSQPCCISSPNTERLHSSMIPYHAQMDDRRKPWNT